MIIVHAIILIRISINKMLRFGYIFLIILSDGNSKAKFMGSYTAVNLKIKVKSCESWFIIKYERQKIRLNF